VQTETKSRLPDADGIRITELLSGDGADIAGAFQVLIQRARTAELAKAWGRAERAFFQAAPLGPPMIDDAAALSEARALLERGIVGTPNAARMRVARRLAKHSGASPKSIAERLRRKWDQDQKKPATYHLSGTSDCACLVPEYEKDGP
jgi:hypothetical protein